MLLTPPVPTFRFYDRIIFGVSEKTTRGSSLRGDRRHLSIETRTASHFCRWSPDNGRARDTLKARKGAVVKV